MPRRELFAAYQELGFTKYEAFSQWPDSRHLWTGDPAADRAEAAEFGLIITSYHIPQIGADLEAGLSQAIAAARYASQLGDNLAVLFKADTRELMSEAAPRFLEALERENIAVLPVVQNHKGTAITTLDDYREVLQATPNPRLRGVLEVGHFAKVDTSWEAGWELLEGRLGLIHVNDIRDGESVRFGSGEVDFAGLLRRVKAGGYSGNIVVELELANRETDPAQTLEGLAEAIAYLEDLWESA